MKKILENKKNIAIIIGIVAMVVFLKNFDVVNYWKSLNPKKGDFIKVGKMSVPRYNHNTLLLDDGKVLIYGGVKSGAKFFGAEIYNPKNRRFNHVGEPRAGGEFSMTLLKSGKVLLIGYFKKTDLFNPDTNMFEDGCSINYPRHHHTATLLDDGRVLITGGQSIDPAKGFNNQGLKFAEYSEIYNPETGKFTIGPKMNIPRSDHSAVLLKDGRVLVVGGFKKNENLASAEIYDPKTNKFKLVDNMNIPRQNPNLYLLKNGKVLISGGVGNQDKNKGIDSVLRREIEIFNPETNEFKIIAKRNSLPEHPAEILLNDDKILFTGGCTGVGLSLIYYKYSETFDPQTNQFTKGKDMNFLRAGHRMTLLKDGNVLITGSEGTNKMAELYINK